MRVLRGFTGLLAGGLVALVLAMGIAWIVATNQDAPGPGPARVLGHLAAAAAAVAAQLYADRHRDVRGVLASLLVVLVTGAVLAIAWIA